MVYLKTSCEPKSKPESDNFWPNLLPTLRQTVLIVMRQHLYLKPLLLTIAIRIYGSYTESFIQGVQSFMHFTDLPNYWLNREELRFKKQCISSQKEILTQKLLILFSPFNVYSPCPFPVLKTGKKQWYTFELYKLQTALEYLGSYYCFTKRTPSGP